jgi:hypothetical protein
MTWVPCDGCDDFWCTAHGAHIADCDCPEIQDWETDPYADDREIRSGASAGRASSSDDVSV